MNAYALKFIMLGDCRVGKSQLTRAFNNKSINLDAQTTVGMEFSTKTLEFEKCTIRAQLWDTAGQERFGQTNMTRAYYRDAVGAAIVFDVTDRQSFLNVKIRWLKQLEEFGHQKMKIILVGNKIDLTEDGTKERAITREEALEFAQAENIDYVETSALTGFAVQILFRRLIFSVAKLIPDVKNNLELTSLPDGWVIKLPPDPNEAAENNRPRAVSDDASTTIESSVTVASYVTSKNAPSSLDSKMSRIDRRKSTMLRVSYVNYWTGESQTTAPAVAAAPGLLFCALPIVKQLQQGDAESETSIQSTATNTTVREVIEEGKIPSDGSTPKRRVSRQESANERALTERSSSVKTVDLKDPDKKPKVRKCYCLLL